jgi:hypothetical protein
MDCGHETVLVGVADREAAKPPAKYLKTRLFLVRDQGGFSAYSVPHSRARFTCGWTKRRVGEKSLWPASALGRCGETCRTGSARPLRIANGNWKMDGGPRQKTNQPEDPFLLRDIADNSLLRPQAQRRSVYKIQRGPGLRPDNCCLHAEYSSRLSAKNRISTRSFPSGIE